MRSAVFVTVRTASTRLPRKALRLILGRPTIALVIERAKLATRAEGVVVCSTEEPEDDTIQEIAEACGVSCFRGSTRDKLERWRGAALENKVELFATMDGDDLLCDPGLLDAGLEQLEASGCDLLRAPEGLICGAFTYAVKVSALEQVCASKSSVETEMMWDYFESDPAYAIRDLQVVEQRYFDDRVRLTLDYPEDLEFFSEIFSRLPEPAHAASLGRVLDILDREPGLREINWFRQRQFLDNQQRIIAHQRLSSDTVQDPN